MTEATYRIVPTGSGFQVEIRRPGETILVVAEFESEAAAKSLAGLGIFEPDTSQRRGEALVRVEAGEGDGLVADEAGASVNGMRVAALGLEVGLGADDEEAAGLVKVAEPIE